MFGLDCRVGPTGPEALSEEDAVVEANRKEQAATAIISDLPPSAELHFTRFRTAVLLESNFSLGIVFSL